MTRLVSRSGVLALLALAILALPLAAEQPANEDLHKIQELADQIKAQADACARMKCPQADCASLAAMMQALIDAETILDALHNALLEQDALMREAYNNAASSSHLTGTKLAQLQDSLAWQEFFHKLGSYLLKMESILNTLNKNIGSMDVKGINPGQMSADQALQSLDSLANLAKNVADIGTDLSAQLANGEIPSTPETKELLNQKWDVKSEGVDLGKIASGAHDAFKSGGARELFDNLKESRNVLTLLGRTLKIYSEKKLKEEKAVLKDLLGNEGPEADAVKRAYEAWQKVRERKFAAEEALAAVRQAKDALTACMTKAGCGAKTLSRPPIPAYPGLGEALRDLDARLPELAKRLAAGVKVTDKCPEPKTSPQPPEPPKGDGPSRPLPPPRHVVENTCPQCAEIALELARTLDEMEFDGQELHRIRAKLEKAQDLEKDAQILRDAVKRITDLIDKFRNGKADRNALQKAGDALFRFLGKPHTQIDLEMLEWEKRDRQNKLHNIEERIAALRAEEGRIPALEKDQMRLYELSEKLKIQLEVCQKRCAPTPTPTPPPKAGKTIGMAPPPVKTGKIRIGLVYPSDARPGEQVCGKVVNNPQDWKSSPLVRVAEIDLLLPLDGAGKAILEQTLISFDNGPAQAADGPVTCQMPKSGTTTVSIRTGDSATPVGQTQVICPAGAAAQALPPSVPQVCVASYLFAVQGPFTADPKTTSVTVGDKPATLMTGTPRGWNCVLPSEATPGAATVVVEEKGRRMTARTAVLALVLGADKTNLLRGESTAFSVKVLGLGGIPESAWTTPTSPDPMSREMLARTAPGVEAREGDNGKVLLIIENRSSEVISVDGEKAGRIVLTIDRAAILNGAYEYKGMIRSKQTGGFNIRATVIPLMAPVPLHAE